MHPALLTITLLVLAVSTASATNSSSYCGAFTTCADCACSSYSYDARLECNPGCVWVSDLSTCHAAEDAPADLDVITNAYMYPKLATTHKARMEELQRGHMMCPHRTPTGVMPFLIGSLLLMSVGLCHVVGYYLLSKFYYTGRVDGLMNSVKQSVRPGETVLWEEVTTSATLSFTAVLGLCIMYIAAFGLQPLVRLVYVLPDALDSDLGVTFFFPMCIAGAIGCTVMLATMGSLGAPRGRSGSAFVITDKSLVYARGYGTRPGQTPVITRMTDVTMGSVQSVTLQGKTVDFELTVGTATTVGGLDDPTFQTLRSGKSRVSLRNLRQPAEVFKLLQSLKAGKGVVMATPVECVSQTPRLASMEGGGVSRRTAGGYSSVGQHDEV